MIKKHSDIVVLIICWIVSIYSLIMVFFKSYQIGLSNYIGYGLLTLISVLRFYKVRRFKTFLGVFLILGSFNIYQLTYSSITMVFGWAPFGKSYNTIGIQPLSFALLIFLIILNYSHFRDLVDDFFAEDPKTRMEKEKRIALSTYDKLKNEKDERLHEIVANKTTYRVDYYSAAKTIIEEREANKNSL
jgi:hypothetical protein